MTKPVSKRVCLGLAALLLWGGMIPGTWAWGHGFHGEFHGHDGFHGHDHFHSHFDFFIGAPLFWWPPYPYYYYPPVSQTYIEQPPVYVQRNDAAASPTGANYWYYCQNPQGYYPYVQNCPAGWMQVVPQPPPQ